MKRLLALILGGATLACAADTVVAPINQPPTISFTYKPIAVQRGTEVDLTVSIADPNAGDALVVSWSITSGTLASKNTANTVMAWTVPNSVGVDTVIVSVTDGELTARVTEILKRGTRRIGETLGADLTLTNSPYILTPPGLTVAVDPGTNPTIEAGVEVFIDKLGMQVEIQGTLGVEGTASDHVVIRPNDRSLKCQGGRGWWDGLKVSTGTGVLDMNYGEVWYGKNNVRLLDTGRANIRNSIISCGLDAGLAISSAGALVVEDSDISNNASYGISVAAISTVPDSVRIVGNTISINGNTGIHLDINDQAQTAIIRIEGNKIHFNFTNGIVATHSVFPLIYQNDFQSNGLSGGLSNIRLQTPYPNGVPFDTLQARNNYWGGSFTSRTPIDQTITDNLDNANIGTRVNVVPWLNVSPLP